MSGSGRNKEPPKMNTLKRLSVFLAFTAAAFAQTNFFTQTTLSASVASADRTINVTSATGINAPSQGTVGSQLYVISPGNNRGETMLVQTVVGTVIGVARGRTGNAGSIPNGALVMIGLPNWYRSYDPAGGCVTASTYISPHVNVLTGAEFLCSPITLSWVAGFGNFASPPAVTAAVASAAGAITPSGPLFHVTGALAITGFTLAIGQVGGTFTIIPDGTFTWTTAGNIGIAGTAVVNRPLTFTWDATNSKWVPSDIS